VGLVPLNTKWRSRPRGQLCNLSLCSTAASCRSCKTSAAFASDAADLFKVTAVLNPTFKGSTGIGGADADIIVDKTLIEFKCTAKADGRKLHEGALQLLGYVLLDYSDE